jgi:hypothetical protein
MKLQLNYCKNILFVQILLFFKQLKNFSRDTDPYVVHQQIHTAGMCFKIYY